MPTCVQAVCQHVPGCLLLSAAYQFIQANNTVVSCLKVVLIAPARGSCDVKTLLTVGSEGSLAQKLCMAKKNSKSICQDSLFSSSVPSSGLLVDDCGNTEPGKINYRWVLFFQSALLGLLLFFWNELLTVIYVRGRLNPQQQYKE